MNSTEIESRKLSFDDCAQRDENGVEFWSARDLMGLLGYTSWQNFEKAIERAKTTLATDNIPVQAHFNDAIKMASLGNGTHREVKDYRMTRYACYLVAMNGDPRKEEIAFAQSYFAISTRRHELIEQRMSELKRLHERHSLTESEKELSRVAYEHGVDDEGFAIVRSRGDFALFGGHNTKDMKKRLGVPDNKPLADALPAMTLTAKSLTAQMTSYNVEHNELFGTDQVAYEHVTNNAAIRQTLTSRGIYPEDLPPEEDAKKVERRVKDDERKLKDGTASFRPIK